MSRPRGRPYSARVHQRLVDRHAKCWEEMHAYRIENGDDDTYRDLRAAMIAAARALATYADSHHRVTRASDVPRVDQCGSR